MSGITNEFQRHQARCSKVDFPASKQHLTPFIRYSVIRPIQFSDGDIVEVQFVFLLVPVNRDKHQLQLVLQSLTRLSNTFSQVRAIMSMLGSSLQGAKDAFISQAARIMWPSSLDSLTPSIKRQVGYVEDEDDIGSMQNKMAGLEIHRSSGSRKQFKALATLDDNIDMEMRQE